eukprot:11115027-Heterocapsa_arctica.AAC.1
MQSSGGSWQAASASFLDDAIAWRPAAALLADEEDLTPYRQPRAGFITWNMYSFPLVSPVTYLGARIRSRRSPAIARPTTHCGWQ